MDAVEVSHLCEIAAQTGIKFRDHLILVSFQLLGAIFRQFRYCRLSRVPIARSLLIEIGRARSKPPESIAEDSRSLTGQCAPQLDSPVFDTLVRGLLNRR